MDTKKICSMVDHTVLKQTTTWEDIKALCDDAIAYGTASVCISPCYVKRAHDYVDGKMAICTVIGFPNGSNTTAARSLRPRTPSPTALTKSTWSSTSAS